MEGSLRTPFIIRWPGMVPAGRVIVDIFTTLAHVGGAEVPKDRATDGVDQLDFFLGNLESSNREGFPAYVADRLSAVNLHAGWADDSSIGRGNRQSLRVNQRVGCHAAKTVQHFAATTIVTQSLLRKSYPLGQ